MDTDMTVSLFSLMVLSAIVGLFSFLFLFFPIIIPYFRKGTSKSYYITCLLICLSCTFLILFLLWKMETDHQKEVKAQNETSHTNDLKYSDEVLKEIGDSVDVKSFSNTKGEYNISYKDKNGELQWFVITPKEEEKVFNKRIGNMRIVLDETKHKNELVREKNKFVVQKPILFGQETKEYYPMYTLYISDEESITNDSHIK